MDANLLTYGGKRRIPLWQVMLVGLLLGVAAGLALAPGGLVALPADTLTPLTEWIMLPARLFLALITMVVIPLVFCSILLSVTESGGMDFLRRTGIGVIVYFTLCTFVAVGIGLLVSHLVNPAQYAPANWLMAGSGTLKNAADAAAKLTDDRSLPQLIVDVIPVNPLSALIDQKMLSIVIGAFLAGLALLSLPRQQAQPVIDVCAGVLAACMKIIFWVLWLAPFAVFGFLFRLVVETGAGGLAGLAGYIAAVLLGLLCIMACYMLVVWLGARRSPAEFIKLSRDVIVLAFCSSSSSATMPLTLSTAENAFKVRPEIARLVIPMGTIINMDGTAVYQIIVALFLTSLLGIDLTMMQTVVLCTTIVFAAIGTPGTPGVGLVVLAVILSDLGIPPEAIGVILSVDRLLDMCRTVINVMGDLTAAVLFDRLTPYAMPAGAAELQGKSI